MGCNTTEVFLKIFNEKYYFFSRYRSSLISIKKWLQSNDYKKMAEVPFPFLNFNNH